MRILVISNLYPPDFLGGYELGCRQVVTALREAGHTVHVLTGSPRNPTPHAPDVHRRLKLTDIYDPYSMWKSRPLTHRTRYLEAHGVHAFNVHALGEAVESFRPDVAYVWNTIGLGGLGLLAGLQFLGVPWVMHLMDDVPRSLCSLERGLIPGVADAFSRACRGRFICCSQTTVAEIAAGGVPIGDRTTLIPNWVTTAGTQDRDDHMPGGVVRVVTAGAMSTVKGMDIIIKAAGLLTARGVTNFTVDMYGPGTDPLFRTLIQSLGLQDRVRIMGVRTQAELAALFPTYDVFAFPTWEREPMAFAPLEAMAHGCVVVTSRVSGNAEWLVDGLDCLKTDRSPEGVADVLGQVAGGAHDLGAIGRRAARLVVRDFHLRVQLPRIVGVLRDAARTAGPAQGTAADMYRVAVLAEKSFQCLIQESAAA